MEAEYKVEGMTCGGCVASVKKALQRALPEVNVDVTLESGTVRVAGEHEERDVKQAIEDAGFDFIGARG